MVSKEKAFPESSLNTVVISTMESSIITQISITTLTTSRDSVRYSNGIKTTTYHSFGVRSNVNVDSDICQKCNLQVSIQIQNRIYISILISHSTNLLFLCFLIFINLLAPSVFAFLLIIIYIVSYISKYSKYSYFRIITYKITK